MLELGRLNPDGAAQLQCNGAAKFNWAGWTRRNMTEQRHNIYSRVATDAFTGSYMDVLEQQAVSPLERASDPIQESLNRAAQALLGRQAQDGHWRFDLEADATIPSEYILLQHF